ncbi:hypothetical protein POSPLADRAFT_1075641 [Postia placenta MAD-698-R-SB12]|uniref:RGS domain-containing protein n=1 Tax=Postia placenta MAD-698-R-SB12 TaxID=670580 RepID=A0A1X6MTF3_9APHY|nr:hypothetical protein POSPLADRAFT_1075641 [Postia placenta MAD-698-R-SB12]OSX59506.1 hypothetical protein POSPLADRAFT_1075641 [Postia placenta MAD-698-R-SB12]
MELLSNYRHRNGGGTRAYTAFLQQYANRVTRRSHLSEVKLENILSGDTCYPISLTNFEAYLIHEASYSIPDLYCAILNPTQEYTVENLQFVVWFQDYRERFMALPDKLQASSPGRTDFAFAVPSPARTAQRVADSMRQADQLRRADASTSPILSRNPSHGRSRSSSDERNSTAHSPFMSRDDPPHASITPESRQQPFRKEGMRIVATFFKPGAAKELPLDPVVRDTVIRDLTWNTHPDVFLPAYEEIYHILETTSLPRFLASASANINRPKQLFWYAVGIADVLLGVVLAIVLITALPAPPQASRAWRLFAVPLAGIGFMQAYSAWRGFCSEVWGRGHTQLRVWELQEMDAEAAHHWARVLRPDASPRHKSAEKAQVCTIERVDDVRAIAPFAADRTPPPSEGRRSSKPGAGKPLFTRLPGLGGRRGRDCDRRSRDGDDGARADEEVAYARPPVFGPERVVLDPRIQAVHRQIMRDMLYAGFWFTLAFTVLILAVPAYR